jgi:ADP-ribosyl-[dinitrogen reductase] hydrolase
MELERTDRIFGGLWGAIVGDALGVPFESVSRKILKSEPIVSMKGYSFPPGTWSDDSSLILCTAEGLARGSDIPGIADLFVRWLKYGYWSPYGDALGIGRGTHLALTRISKGTPAEKAGGDDEFSNGNGSLMRILPIALFYANEPPKMLQMAHRLSAITHRHPRSQIACGIYCLMVAGLLTSKDASQALQNAVSLANAQYQYRTFSKELHHFDRVLQGDIAEIPEQDIESSGYVVHTLEASIWCLLTTSSFREGVLKAVNLGDDTDTTACVTGGLAGVLYGVKAIPKEWIDVLPKKDKIENLLNEFAARCST